MEDFVRRGPRTEHQWHSTSLASSRTPNPDKADYKNGEGLGGGLGTGALHFIRNRGSVRRQLKREASNRNKTSNEGRATTLSTDSSGGSHGGGGGGGGGGFGKWLREHLGGGSRSTQESIVPAIPPKNRPNASYDLSFTGSDKALAKTTYTPQNVYCSLPREQHRRHSRGSVSKSSLEVPRERVRCFGGSVVASRTNNYRERASINEISSITRGGPFYGSEGKSSRRRERERRRHSMNETRAHSRHRRISHLLVAYSCNLSWGKMVDGMRESREGLESKASSNEAEVEPAENGGEEVLSMSELKENEDERDPERLPNDDIVLSLDDQNIEETSKVISDTQMIDYAKSFEDSLEESDSDEGIEGTDQIQFHESYEEEIPASISREFYDGQGDEEEEEEEIYSTESSLAGLEKLDEGVIDDTTEPSESDVVGLLADIPLEILRDRMAVIEKLRELKIEGLDLSKKNRLLQYWVARLMKKKHQTMTPEDEVLAAEVTDDRYMKKLVWCKTTMEEIEARQAEFHRELANMEMKLGSALEEDSITFDEFLAREKEVGVGLVFEKSGRTIGVKAMEAVLRRELLNRDRFKYIYYRHVYEDVKTKLRRAQNLGAGMTILDYDVLRVDNENYKEKLEERDKVLEKIAIRIETIVGTLAHYKEKDVENRSRIYNERKYLEIVRSEALRTRAAFAKGLTLLWSIRNECLKKKHQAGMLFVLPVVREMEKTIKALDELKVELERMISIGELNEGVGSSRNKLQVDENRTTMTGMTTVKSGGRMKTRPGRC